MWDDLLDLLNNAVVIVGVTSFAFFVGSLCLTLFVLLRLPKDFWLRYLNENRSRDHFALWWLRNTLAVVIALAGVAMLVLPGQGLLTLLVALIVSNFSWKNRIITKFISNMKVRGALNTLRRKFHKESFVFDESK